MIKKLLTNKIFRRTFHLFFTAYFAYTITQVLYDQRLTIKERIGIATIGIVLGSSSGYIAYVTERKISGHRKDS